MQDQLAEEVAKDILSFQAKLEVLEQQVIQGIYIMRHRK